MRICIDVSSIVYGTGVSLYTSNLTRSLIDIISPSDKLTVYGNSLRRLATLKQFALKYQIPNTSFYPIPPKLTHLIFHQLNIPINRFIGSQDVFHAWDWYLPRSLNTAMVTTVHDISQFHHKDTAHPEILLHHQNVINRLKKLPVHIIAVSESTKNDLMEYGQIDGQRIHVIPEALPLENEITPDEKNVKNVHNKYSINKPYFLIVGTKEPRKNHQAQIEAWKAYANDFDLVIIGKKGWVDIKPQTGVHLFDQVSALDLACFYTGASLLLYASLYEGFGLPILEAFYHHLPVVTSNNSSMKEIADTAASLVDPHDVDSISQGIGKALDSGSDLVSKGNIRLTDFSWEKTARETYKIYKSICS